jgi:hypothetical protein
MRDKKVRIGGKNYRLVARSDGRYNIYAEGHTGSLGSTPLSDVKSFIKSMNAVEDLSKLDVVPNSKYPATVSFADYKNHNETSVTEMAQENDNFDPYSFLNIPSNANTRQIRKALKEKKKSIDNIMERVTHWEGSIAVEEQLSSFSKAEALLLGDKSSVPLKQKKEKLLNGRDF